MAQGARRIAAIGARRSIGTALLLIAALLLAFFAGQVVLAWQEGERARDIARIDRISQSLVDAITQLGIVRGFTMTFLARPAPTSDDDTAALARRYAQGADQLSAARAELPLLRADLAPRLDSAMARAAAGWERARREMPLAGERRDAAFAQGWFGLYNGVIAELEALLVDVRSPGLLQDFEFALLADVRIAMLRWRLLRTREMGVIGVTVSTGTIGSAATLGEIDALRARADLLFDQIQLHVGTLRSAALADALRDADAALAPLNRLYAQARDAWRVGQPTPIAPADHDRLTLAAIEAIHRLIGAVSEETRRHAAALEATALTRTLAGFALFSVGAILAFLSWRIVARAVVEPLEMLSGVARRVAAGERAARVPERGAAEIREAAARFNAMLDSVQRTQDELERSNAALDRGHRAIAARERQMRTVTDNLPAFIARLDAGQRLQFVNDVAERWLARPEAALIGAAARALMADGPWPAAADAGAPAALATTETTARWPDGVTRTVACTLAPDVEADGRVAGHFVLALDVTERRRAEEELSHAQRIDALGKLTGGVAHDFNNLLAVICGNVELLAERLGDRPDLQALARKALLAGDRGATLTRSLLAFARRQALQPTAVDVSRLIDEMSELIRRTLPENIAVRLAVGEQLWPCLADAGQLQNALLNLVVNARDAMPQGGTLSIEAANVALKADDIAAHAELEPGDYVMLAVSDTGTGMPPEVVAHAFEPFFTTKTPGKGTGLGLSMVYGFARQSKGEVAIRSAVGAGTTITLRLPRAAGAVAAPPPSPDRAPTGAETLLVVEDEPEVRALLAEQLSSLGYRVETAARAAEALHLLAARRDIALMLSDIVLAGGLDGRQLAARVRILRPGLPVAFISGYSEVATSNEADHGAPLLQKPFTKAELAATVRAALDRAAAPRPAVAL